MSESKIEEIICALWVIAAIIAFGFGYTSFGTVLAVKAAFDFVLVVFLAVKELMADLIALREGEKDGQ